jgi:hypothetical protein
VQIHTVVWHNMKTSLSITIFFIFINFACLSQTFTDTLIKDIQKYSLVSIVKRDLAVLKDDRHYVSVYESEYDFGAKTLNCQFSYNKFWYTLVGHFINDNIFSIELSKRIEDNDITVYNSEFQFLDTVLAEKHLKKHNSFFTSNKILPDFFSTRFERFSYSCGFVSQTPESMIDCLAIIKNKDKNDLVTLATSISPTDRAYGVFGLYILERIGNNLTVTEKELIKLNQKSTAEAYSCSGCITGTQSLKSLLDSKSLRWYYDWYKRIGKSY